MGMYFRYVRRENAYSSGAKRIPQVATGMRNAEQKKRSPQQMRPQKKFCTGTSVAKEGGCDGPPEDEGFFLTTNAV